MKSNRQVIGIISFDPTSDDDTGKTEAAEIYAIYISPEHFREEYGSQLLNKALVSLRNKSFTLVTLWVLTQNFSWRSFYEALCFSSNQKFNLELLKDHTKMDETQYYIDL